MISQHEEHQVSLLGATELQRSGAFRFAKLEPQWRLKLIWDDKTWKLAEPIASRSILAVDAKNTGALDGDGNGQQSCRPQTHGPDWSHNCL